MKFRFIARLAAALVVVWIHVASAAPDTVPPARIRVAIIETGKDQRVRRIGDIAEAELGEGGTIQLLERQNVERLLTEQHLSLSGLVDANQAVRAGRILAADLIAVLESDALTSDCGLTVFDPRTGARFFDAGIAMGADERAAKSVAKAITDSAAKYAISANLHTLCLMTVRNADLPRDMDGFCEAVGTLLERNLCGGSSVVVLERRQLEQVSKERALAADAGHDLLASLVVVELDISRGAEGHGLVATALLSDNAGKNTGKLTVTSKERDAVELADALTASLSVNLQLPPAAAIDRQVEGRRFLAEANIRCGSSDFTRAVIAAESAHALIPDDLLIRALLARALASKGYRSLSDDRGQLHKPAAVSGDALRGATMMSELLARAVAAEPATQAAVLKQLADAENQTLNYVRFYSVLGGVTGEIDVVRKPLRQYHHDRDDFDVAQVKDEASFKEYSFRQYGFIWNPTNVAFCADSQEWTTDLLYYCRKWVTLHRQYPNAILPLDPGYVFARSWLGQRNRLAKGLRFRPNLEPTAADYARLREIQRELSADPALRVRCWGDLCGLCIDACQARPSDEKVKSLVGDFVAAHMQWLRQDDMRDMENRHILYCVIDEADALLDGTPWQGEHSRMLLNYMLDQHEIDYDVVLRGVRQGFWFDEKVTPEKAAEQLSLANRSFELLKAPDCRRVRSVAYFDDIFRAELDRLRRPGDLAIAATCPWQNSLKLIDVFDKDEAVVHPLIHDQSVYVLHLCEPQAASGKLRLELLRILLAGGKAENLGSVDLSNASRAHWQSTYRSGTSIHPFPAACIAEGKYCIATEDRGVLVFPLAGGPALSPSNGPALGPSNGPVQQIDQARGFPSQRVQAVAVLDGTLYAGLGNEGNGYIAGYDFASGQTDVLASNSRKQKRSPFDDGSAFAIQGLYADAPRHRLIAAIHPKEPRAEVTGLWEYVPSTQQWRHLVLFDVQNIIGQDSAAPVVDGNQRPGLVHDEQLQLLNLNGIFLFNLRDDSLHLTFAPNPSPQPRDLPLMTGASSAGIKAWGFTQRKGVAALDFPWIWTNFYDLRWGRMNLTTGQNEYFPPLRHGNENDRFLPTTIIRLRENSGFLVSDDRGIWVLTGTRRVPGS